ncbi:MAG: very short patch repair endonuclease [Cryobacterium sp.]|nr:very short patch repair endonuclease [Cryobacterium sp.]MBX3310508.1 very short patch repair endonuclease [Cryobacterium sp.]
MSLSWASSEHARHSMMGNRSSDTKPELFVRQRLHAMGLRYRTNARPEKDLRRTADILFTRARVVVLIDGCYWHGCPDHCRMPVMNREYWEAKIARNRERDCQTTKELTRRGWRVLRFWSHEDPDAVARKVSAAVRTDAPL